jgi:hypothetical protein
MKSLYSVVLGGFLAMGGMVAVRSVLPAGELTEERFARIQNGMPYKEVVNLIGRPTSVVWKDEEFQFCVWSPKTVNASITFYDGAVYHKEW